MENQQNIEQLLGLKYRNLIIHLLATKFNNHVVYVFAALVPMEIMKYVDINYTYIVHIKKHVSRRKCSISVIFVCNKLEINLKIMEA